MDFTDREIILSDRRIRIGLVRGRLWGSSSNNVLFYYHQSFFFFSFFYGVCRFLSEVWK